MKPLAIWLVLFGLAFGGYAGATHVIRTANPDRVLVIVDSSFPMQRVWSQVPGLLGRLDDREYAEFALATEKGPVHSWSSRLSLGDTVAFAPCDFGRITSLPDLESADEVVLVTTSSSCPTDGLPGPWGIIRVD